MKFILVKTGVHDETRREWRRDERRSELRDEAERAGERRGARRAGGYAREKRAKESIERAHLYALEKERATHA